MPKLSPKMSIRVHVHRSYDKPGAAADILASLKNHGLNLTHLSADLHCFSYDGATIELEVDGVGAEHPRAQAALQEIRASNFRVEVIDPCPVPWFPICRKELDECVEDIGANTGGLVDPGHPGFEDSVYKARREEIAKTANRFREGDSLDACAIDYTAEEHSIWEVVYGRLKQMHLNYACEEFNECFVELEEEAGYSPVAIPQLADVSGYLESKTGFSLRPVCGLLSARDFLNSLAFRVFCSTQYIRHGANPLYTPEPDVCHELIGHVPLLAEPQFAEFTQKVGLASLGASDEEVMKLANIYWFTVEFGLLKSRCGDDVKVMGAGILSSLGEMEWAAAAAPSEECREAGGISKHHPLLAKPNLLPFDPMIASDTPYPITTLQPTFFVGETLHEVKTQINDYCDTRLQKNFHPVYNPITRIVSPSRHITRLPRNSDLAAVQAEKQSEYFKSLSASLV